MGKRGKRVSASSLRAIPLWGIVVVGLALVVAGCGAGGGGGGDDQAATGDKPKTITLTAGCSDPKGYLQCDALDRIASIVKAKTNGGLIIENHYQAFGAEGILAQKVQAGSVDVGNLSSNNSAAFTKAYLVYDLPFLFPSNDAAMEVVNGPLGQKLSAQWEKDTGFKLLTTTSFGVGRDIETTDTKLAVPQDIYGLKIRTTESPVDLVVFKAWGANASPLDYAQTFAALQQGVVDGEAVALTGLIPEKHDEVIKHIVQLSYQLTFNQLLMNQSKFDSLPADYQKALTDASSEIRQWQLDQANQRVADDLKRLESKGIEVIEPTDEQRQQWVSIGKSTWKEIARKLGVDLQLAKQLSDAAAQ